MAALQTARDAKEFLIARIVEEATRENVGLSEVERKMLYFSETHWTLPDIAAVSETFDREYNQDEYERKITRLINAAAAHAYQHAEQYDLWWDAVRLLRKEDHYILVMFDNADLPPHPGSHGAKAQLGNARSIGWLIGHYCPLFLGTFLVCFLWMHLIGPRRTAGYWQTHEPLSSLTSAIVSALIALTLTVLVMRRGG